MDDLIFIVFRENRTVVAVVSDHNTASKMAWRIGGYVEHYELDAHLTPLALRD
jgi:hypothetical protein